MGNYRSVTVIPGFEIKPLVFVTSDQIKVSRRQDNTARFLDFPARQKPPELLMRVGAFAQTAFAIASLRAQQQRCVFRCGADDKALFDCGSEAILPPYQYQPYSLVVASSFEKWANQYSPWNHFFTYSICRFCLSRLTGGMIGKLVAPSPCERLGKSWGKAYQQL